MQKDVLFKFFLMQMDLLVYLSLFSWEWKKKNCSIEK